MGINIGDKFELPLPNPKLRTNLYANVSPVCPSLERRYLLHLLLKDSLISPPKVVTVYDTNGRSTKVVIVEKDEGRVSSEENNFMVVATLPHQSCLLGLTGVPSKTDRDIRFLYNAYMFNFQIPTEAYLLLRGLNPFIILGSDTDRYSRDTSVVRILADLLGDYISGSNPPSWTHIYDPGYFVLNSNLYYEQVVKSGYTLRSDGVT